MAIISKKRWVDYLILGLSVFLCFCLLFESQIVLPGMVSWLGNWHPVLLHFPIVLVIILVILNLSGKKVPYLLLAFSCLAALVTGITGFLLGLGTEGKGELLFWHQWLGAGVAIGLVIWYWLATNGLEQHIVIKTLGVVLLVLIGFTGHYGGMITHGEDFLALPSSKQLDKIPENPLIYEHVVGRILENNCVKCHNPNKTKGELLMTNLGQLLKGGESGNTIIPGVPEESELVARLKLPAQHEDHMPPDGDTPLSKDEIQILERWIALGASDTLRFEHLSNTDPLANLITDLMRPDPMEKWAKLPVIADSTIAGLSSDYLTITRLAATTHALRIAMYKPPIYDPNPILNLLPIAKNIVELDLSGLPIGSDEMNMVASCSNLEWLEINSTPITDADIDTLKVLSKLKLLKVYETNIGDPSAALFNKWQELQRLYLWETKVSAATLEQLEKNRPRLMIHHGIDADLESFFASQDSILQEDGK